MKIKVNGKPWNWDSKEIYAGESPNHTSTLLLLNVLIWSALSTFIMYKWGYLLLIKAFTAAMPDIARWVGL